jgi:hypothetical protein
MSTEDDNDKQGDRYYSELSVSQIISAQRCIHLFNGKWDVYLTWLRGKPVDSEFRGYIPEVEALKEMDAECGILREILLGEIHEITRYLSVEDLIQIRSLGDLLIRQKQLLAVKREREDESSDEKPQ